ncbi:MAG: hypothetical protein CL534_23310 [Ahrensia sp.]|nr:hypothetical protein [Ahrensia sp.]
MAEPYPPLSLRDISPARGESGTIPQSAVLFDFTPTNMQGSTLPPRGGDVGAADRGGALDA